MLVCVSLSNATTLSLQIKHTGLPFGGGKNKQVAFRGRIIELVHTIPLLLLLQLLDSHCYNALHQELNVVRLRRVFH